MRYIYYLLIVIQLTACAAVDSMIPFYNEQAVCLLRQNFVKKPANQMIALTMPSGEKWQKVGNPTMLIPKNDYVERPLETIVTKSIAYEANPFVSAHRFYENEVALAKKQCRVVNATILSEGKDTLFYQLDIAQCERQHDQKKIGKIFNGSDAVYAVRYKAEPSIPEKKVIKMADTIKTARLVKANTDQLA